MGNDRTHIEHLDDGDWWVDDVGCLHAADNVDESFDTLFLRHLGHIKLSVRGEHIGVTWDVAAVDEYSAGFIAEWLRATTGKRALLRYFYYGWAEEKAENGREAAGRMNEIQMLRSVRQIPSTYVENQGAFEPSAAPPGIRRGYDIWRRTRGRLADATQDECNELLPQILFYRPERRSGDLVFTWVGSHSLSARVHGRAWTQRALRSRSFNTVGSETSDYVDRIATAYQDVWDTGAPHYARIQTLLSPQPEQDPIWLTYHRLLLRFRLHDGKPALMCLSKKVGTLSKPLPDAP